MTEQVRITVLVENTVYERGLLAEHGLAYWIEVGSQYVLFDTGQGGVLAGNAFRLKAPLSHVDAVVLSHGHFDHTGALAESLRGARSEKIYAHPAALEPKFARNRDGTSREIGIPYPCKQAVQQRRDQWVLTEKPTPVAGGLMVTGTVPRVTDFEDTGGPFFLDAACQAPDPLIDDQAIYFESAEGTVVLLGCAHSGVINTLRYVRELTGGRPIHTVMGGMHLVNASEERLQRTLEELNEMKIGHLGPAHCTGRAATAALWNTLPERCFPCHVGTQVEFDLVTPFLKGASLHGAS